VSPDGAFYYLTRSQVFRVLNNANPHIAVLNGGAEVFNATGYANYGTVTQGSPRDITFTVRNNGVAALTLTNPPSVPAGYALVSGFAATTLTTGQSTTLTVRLTAAGPGTFTGAVSFGTNATVPNPFTFTVTGVVNPTPFTAIVDDGDPLFVS